ncbi:hypothetical protein TorRG33x02_123200 [Trema orientale]|uniref:Uncharacterized protein n=1 Tax=Trema orientale TaxID=63057 RepID=A0A2P5F2L6_TREOI|nr:hypothetical protein TorRG33x02_123200 [Trema orientale]
MHKSIDFEAEPSQWQAPLHKCFLAKKKMYAIECTGPSFWIDFELQLLVVHSYHLLIILLF